MRQSLALVLALAIVGIPAAAPSQAVEVDHGEIVAQLRGAYAATTSYVDRLLIASKLARNGDMSHWRWVRNEAKKAVRHGKEQSGFHVGFHEVMNP